MLDTTMVMFTSPHFSKILWNIKTDEPMATEDPFLEKTYMNTSVIDLQSTATHWNITWRNLTSAFYCKMYGPPLCHVNIKLYYLNIHTYNSNIIRCCNLLLVWTYICIYQMYWSWTCQMFQSLSIGLRIPEIKDNIDCIAKKRPKNIRLLPPTNIWFDYYLTKSRFDCICHPYNHIYFQQPKLPSVCTHYLCSLSCLCLSSISFTLDFTPTLEVSA